MMRKPEFLQYKPSQQAAAAFSLAINLATSPNAHKLGLVSLTSVQIFQNEEIGNPLHFWTSEISELSKLTQNDFKAVYKSLIVYVNELFFKGQITNDAALWFPEDLQGIKVSGVLSSPAKNLVQVSPSTCDSTPVQNESC